MRWLLFVPLVILALLTGAFFAFNMGIFHAPLEREVSARLQAKVKLGPVRVTPTWPPHLTIGKTEVEHALGKLSWRGVDVELLHLTAPYSVRLTLEGPSVEMNPAKASQPAPEKNGAGGAGEEFTRPLHVALRIVEGEYRGPEGKVTGIDLIFEQEQLLKSAARIHLKALVEAKSVAFAFPLAVDSDALILTTDSIKTAEMKLAVAGLTASVQGTSVLSGNQHQWSALISAPDLAKLPKPPIDIPAKGWKGSIELQVKVNKENATKPWAIEGEVRAAKVGAEVNWKKNELTVRGPVALDLAARFQYADSQLVIPGCEGQIDFSGAEVVYESMLRKAIGVPLQAKIVATGDHTQLQIREFGLRFWNFALKLNGESKLAAPYIGKLHFEIPKVALKGAEQTLLPLARSPVEGEVELRGEIDGPLAEPWQAHVTIESARFKDVAAHVEYEKSGFVQVRGPLKLTANVVGEWDRGALKRVQAAGELTATGAALTLGPLRKEARQELVASFSAKNSGDVLEVSKFDLRSFFAVAHLNGRVKNLLAPTLENVVLGFSPLNLTELRMAVPQYRDLIPKGVLRAELRLNGRHLPNRPWNEWPLNVDGDVRVQLPEYKMASAQAPVPPAGAPTAPVTNESTSFLPDGYLTQHLRLKVSAEVSTLSKENLVIKGVRSVGAIDKGHYRGEVTLQEIFSGTLKLTQLDVPLLERRAILQGQAAWQNLVVQDAVGFAKPEYKEFAAGRMTGNTSFATYMPSDKDFMVGLKTRGTLQLQPVTLNTIKVGAMLNEMIEKIPEVIRKQAKLQSVKAEPLKGMIRTDFNLHSQAMLVENFLARDLDNSELHLKGKILISTLQGDLAGHFLWAKPQLQGCLLEGNSDAQGRMLIPVAIKGDLMQPGFSILSDLLNKLGGRALQCEQKKLTKGLEEKAKSEAGKVLEQEGKKLLKGFFGK